MAMALWGSSAVLAVLAGALDISAPPPSSALALLPSARLYSPLWDEAVRAPLAWMNTSQAASSARLLHSALRTDRAALACAVASHGRAIGPRRFRLCVGGDSECAEGEEAAAGNEPVAGAWSEDATTPNDGAVQAEARAHCTMRARHRQRPRARCARAPLLLGRWNASLDAVLLTGGSAAMLTRWRRLGQDGVAGALVNAAVQYYVGGDACDATGANGRRHIARLLHYCDGGTSALAIRAVVDAGAAPLGSAAQQHAWSPGCCQCQRSFLVSNPTLCADGGAFFVRQSLVRASDDALEAAFAGEAGAQLARQWKSDSAEIQRAARVQRELTYGEITVEGALNVLDRLPVEHALNCSSSLFDLGSGEGRFTLLAAMVFGVQLAVGIEIVAARHNVGTAARHRLLGLLRAAAGERGAEGVDGGVAQALLANVERTQLWLGDALEPGAFAEATHVYVANLLFGPALNARLVAALLHAPALHCVITLRKLHVVPNGWVLAGEMLAEMTWSSDSDVFFYFKQ